MGSFNYNIHVVAKPLQSIFQKLEGHNLEQIYIFFSGKLCIAVHLAYPELKLCKGASAPAPTSF